MREDAHVPVLKWMTVQGAGPVCTAGKPLTEVWVLGRHLFVPWKYLEQGLVFKNTNAGSRKKIHEETWPWVVAAFRAQERKLPGWVQGGPSMGEGAVISFLGLRWAPVSPALARHQLTLQLYCPLPSHLGRSQAVVV